MAYMDHMDLAVQCPWKAVKLAHSSLTLTPAHDAMFLAESG